MYASFKAVNVIQVNLKALRAITYCLGVNFILKFVFHLTDLMGVYLDAGNKAEPGGCDGLSKAKGGIVFLTAEAASPWLLDTSDLPMPWICYSCLARS